MGTPGFWECERMPFGLSNAPVTFQWLMGPPLVSYICPGALDIWMIL